MCGNDSLTHPPPPPPPPPRTSRALPDVIPSVALAATLLLTGAPALAVLNCEPAQRGTLGADGVTFTPGSSASDIDFLAACTGDGAGDEFTVEVFDDGYDDYLTAGGADVLDSGRSKVVLEVGGNGARVHFDGLGSDTVTVGVFKGTIRGADADHAVNVRFESDAPNELRWDSHADIQTTGGGRGIRVHVDDDAPGRRVRIRNFGSIVTEDADEAGDSDAIRISSNHANVEATNEAGATIETSGKGGSGLFINTSGETATARVVNRGSVTTTGDLDDTGRHSDAVRASNSAGAGTTEAVNEAGGTIRTEGTGARGLTAGSCNWESEDCLPSGEGSATAINRGSITTTGDGAVRSGGGTRNAHAVAVWVTGDGTARAVNEAGGTIRTEGTGARGLSASHDGSLGGAEAENQGDITTTGGMDSALKQSHGLSAWSQHGSARAVNHEGATIVTDGVAADGMRAQNQEGTTDDSASATNRGSITAHGDGFFNEDTFSLVQGVYAVTDEGSASSATALNDETGTVETHGKGARGVEADAFGSGDAESVNRGRITTRGDAFPIDRQGSDGDTYRGATGLSASTQGSGSASARNEVGGIVETHGTAATGLGAWSEGGTATIVNQGQVTTHQTAAVDDLPGYVGTLIGARGTWAWSGSADALVENEETGRVETMGARAFGLFAETENDGSRESAVAQVDNRGTVITHGTNADGMVAIANNGGSADNPDNAGDATVVNTGQVTVSGAGARGLYADTSGTGATAKAVNRGSVTTTGDLDDNDRGADAVRADSNGPDLRTAEVVNEAGATVRTEGDGARGLFASSCNWDGARCTRSGTGSATAINRGSVTTTGNGAARSGGGTRSAYAVFAYLDGDGTARAVNEAEGTIQTEGTGARGLSAVHEGSLGLAEAENEGDITTTGGMDSALRRSHGLHAFSQERSARAVNHEGATIVTEGVAARGMGASIDRGTADGDSATAINRGSITTHGDGFFNEDIAHVVEGVAAYAGFADEGGAVSSATALNDETGTVETHGKGARGVRAGTAGSGDAESVNRGRITTRGDAFPIDRQDSDGDTYHGATGLSASTQGSGSASARNEVGGIVETHGTAATGLGAWSEGGTASIVNQGRVTTHQTDAVDDLPGYVGTSIGARGTWAHSGSANALVENEETGRVETMGARAFGLFAEIENDGSRTSAMARVENRGTVITHGWNADGVAAIARNGGTTDNPNLARAVNEADATIDTKGDGSSGLVAGILVSGSGTVDSSGSARAENRGTIMTSGGLPAGEAGSAANANGVAAVFFTDDPQVTIGNAGDATVVNTGPVTVSGAGAVGLYAGTSGTGAATVTLTGGEVTASHADDDEGGVGILAETGDAGSIAVRVEGGAQVEAPTAVRLVGGSGIDAAALDVIGGSTLTGRVSTLTGRVDLTQAVNGVRMTVAGGSVIDGAVDFGPGDDELVMQGGGLSSIEGIVRGLETMYKRGAGAARVNDVEFSRSAVNLEQGDLILAGHLDLGEEGTVTVHDGTRLAIEVGNILEVADRRSRHGWITAGGGVVFQGEDDPAMSILIASSVSDEQADEIQTRLEETPIDVLDDGTRVLRSAPAEEGATPVDEVGLKTGTGPEERDVGTVDSEGMAMVEENAGSIGRTPKPFAPTPPEPSTPSSGGGGGSSGGGSSAAAFVGGGVLLGALLFDWFDSEDEAAAWEEERTDGGTRTSFADLRSGYSHESRSRAGEVEGWTRALTGDSPVLAGGAEGTVRGVAMGLDAELGRGFHFGVAALPDMAASSRPGPASGFGASLEGGWYAARGGWRGRTLFAKTSVSHGRWRARSLFENPVAGGVLGGSHDLVQDHVGVKAGARLALGGVRATPSVSMYSGQVDQSAYTAQGAALRAEVPGLSQRYRGWKAGLELAPSRWLGRAGALRWRPTLHVSTMRTRTADTGVFDLHQSDRAGVLSFTSRARARGMPGTVHAFGASVTAMRSEGWRLRLGYAGMQVDGEPVHAVAARLRVRF